MKLKKLFALSALMLLPLSACDKNAAPAGGGTTPPGGDGDGDLPGERVYTAQGIARALGSLFYEDEDDFELKTDEFGDYYFSWLEFDGYEDTETDIMEAMNYSVSLLPEYLELSLAPEYEDDASSSNYGVATAELISSDGYVEVDLEGYYDSWSEDDYSFDGVYVDIYVYELYEDGGEGGGGDDTPLEGDVLDCAATGRTGTAYGAWTKTGASGAVYSGESAAGNSAIQLRATNPSGIVTTTSGGKIVSVTIAWNSNTADNRQVDVYVSNTAYSGPADLYASSTRGTKAGSIVYGENTLTLLIDGNYAYVGIRSNNKALYLDSVTFSWEQS